MCISSSKFFEIFKTNRGSYGYYGIREGEERSLNEGNIHHANNVLSFYFACHFKSLFMLNTWAKF